jgi:hypothetical protein
MTKVNFMDKFPINTIEIKKDETTYKNVDEILEQLKNNIEQHPVAKFIVNFDNYAHTASLNGEIMSGMKDAKIIMFCFGAAIPNNKILAIRPRSIGISEFDDKYVFDFMDAPKEELTNIMSTWCNNISNN